MHSLSDTELIARVVTTKDLKAFEVLLGRHQNLVKNWLRQLCADFSQADDIAQECFIQAWHKIQTFRADGQFKNWLLKIAYNCFLQFIRKQKSRGALVQQLETLENKPKQYSDNKELPDLPRLLAILNLEEKACMVLCYSYGYSHTEISAMIDLPLGTVKSHIKRSTEKIRHHFNIKV